MIYDKLENASLYYALHPRFERAFEALQNLDWGQLECGRHDIDGNDIFVNLAEYKTMLPDQGTWEAHRRYIDIQLIIHGEEQMEHAFNDTLQVKEAYDSSKDVEFYTGKGQLITFTESTFAIYFPHDGHKPGLVCGTIGAVRKAVAKIRI